MPIPMISLRDFTLSTTQGHTIKFEAQKKTLVPDDLVALAMSFNIAPADAFDNDQMSTYNPQRAAIVGSLRDSIVLGAMKTLVVENEPESFNAGGQPKLAVINQRTGLRLSGGELSKYWERFREIQSTNSPLPQHPRMDDVLELQALTTRKQLLEFATGIKVDPGMLDKKSIREMKEILMHAAIHYNEAANVAPTPQRDSFTKPSELMDD